MGAADTIFALATAPGRAAIAVMRISGPRAKAAVEALAGAVPAPRVATLKALSEPGSGGSLDRALVLWFPGPASYSGEDMAELHLHGGVAVVAGVARALAGVAGCRPAEPGEFSRRAFANGRLDLTAVEGLADLVAAETEGQRRQALRQMDGALGRLYDGWRARLIRALAHAEAAIEFPEDGLPDGLDDGVRAEIGAVAAAIGGHLDDGGRGERLRDGIRVAIIGAPNVGKSSLLNRLGRSDLAIVSPRPGTTRDVVAARLDLGGVPVTVADTAGLRESADAVEAEGVRRARCWAESADLRIAVFAAPEWPGMERATETAMNGAAVVAVNKIDLTGGRVPAGGPAAVGISCRDGRGLAGLEAELGSWVRRLAAPGSAPALTRARHRAALGECCEALIRAGTASGELAAEDLRLAVRALGRITGRVDVETVLDTVFGELCVGK